MEQSTVSRQTKVFLSVLVLIILLLTALLLCRNCSTPEPLNDEPAAPIAVYDNSFDKVIIARAYLDGVQKTVSTECPRALVGFKFINGRSVKDFNFDGLTYEQAVRIVAEDWKPLIITSLSTDIVLSEQQMAVITLAAMRMGKTGFQRSTFLQKVNENNFAEASDWLLLQKEDGSIRKLGEEATQYFYMLKLLWNNELVIEDLQNLPIFSYRDLPVEKLYSDSSYIFNEDILERLFQGFQPTPLTALGL